MRPTVRDSIKLIAMAIAAINELFELFCGHEKALISEEGKPSRLQITVLDDAILIAYRMGAYKQGKNTCVRTEGGLIFGRYSTSIPYFTE